MFRELFGNGQANVLVVGASRGLGDQFVQQLAQVGVARVFAASRSGTVSKSARNIFPLSLDVTQPASIADAVIHITAYTEQLDAIIYTAGLLHNSVGMQPERKLADVAPGNLQQSFAVNAFGPLLIAQAFQNFLPRRDPCLLAQLSARVGSIEDNRLGGWYTYRAAKAAQNMFTRNLAIELGRKHQGMVCIALHPGTCDTALSKPFQRRVPQLFTPQQAVQQLLEVIYSRTRNHNGGFFAWDGSSIPW